MEKSHECLWPSGLPKPPLLHERSERRDASEHRQHILEVAQHLFSEHGVDAVSMHQIARVAGVGQGTLYRRYARKGELCMDLLSEHYEQLVKVIAAQFAAKVASSPLERLDDILTLLITFLEEQSPLLGPTAITGVPNVLCDDAENSSRFSLQSISWYRWLHDLIAELFTEAVGQGELAPLDTSYTADAILATLHPLIYRMQRQERGFSAERILQGLRRIYIEGMKPAASQAT
jgi:AcrR family transcriptional regulator